MYIYTVLGLCSQKSGVLSEGWWIYVCIQSVGLHMHVWRSEVRGQFLSFCLLLNLGSPTWLAWPVCPESVPASTSSGLGSQSCITTPDFLCGIWTLVPMFAQRGLYLLNPLCNSQVLILRGQHTASLQCAALGETALGQRASLCLEAYSLEGKDLSKGRSHARTFQKVPQKLHRTENLGPGGSVQLSFWETIPAHSRSFDLNNTAMNPTFAKVVWL